MTAQSLDTDMQRLFYSTWPPSFSSHITTSPLVYDTRFITGIIQGSHCDNVYPSHYLQQYNYIILEFPL